MKRLEPVNLKIDTDLDADDFGQRIVDCVRNCNPDLNIVNIVKIDVGDARIPKEDFAHFVKSIRDMFIEVGAKNCVFIPIGNSVGIKDITIDYVRVVEDEIKET